MKQICKNINSQRRLLDHEFPFRVEFFIRFPSPISGYLTGEINFSFETSFHFLVRVRRNVERQSTNELFPTPLERINVEGRVTKEIPRRVPALPVRKVNDEKLLTLKMGPHV